MKTETKMTFFIALIAFFSISVASCSLSDEVTYNVKEDKETGIVYNQDWNSVYDSENAYYNNTNGLVNVRKGPGRDYKVSGYLKPQEGGFIKQCSFDLKFCFLTFGASPEAGWVEMKYLKEGKVEYSR